MADCKKDSGLRDYPALTTLEDSCNRKLEEVGRLGGNLQPIIEASQQERLLLHELVDGLTQPSPEIPFRVEDIYGLIRLEEGRLAELEEIYQNLKVALKRFAQAMPQLLTATVLESGVEDWVDSDTPAYVYFRDLETEIRSERRGKRCRTGICWLGVNTMLPLEESSVKKIEAFLALPAKQRGWVSPESVASDLSLAWHALIKWQQGGMHKRPPTYMPDTRVKGLSIDREFDAALTIQKQIAHTFAGVLNKWGFQEVEVDPTPNHRMELAKIFHRSKSLSPLDTAYLEKLDDSFWVTFVPTHEYSQFMTVDPNPFYDDQNCDAILTGLNALYSDDHNLPEWCLGLAWNIEVKF